jgi:hypothetical protein
MGIYFSSIGNVKDSRSDCDTTKVNQFFKYSKSTNKFFGYTQCTACEKGYKFAQHQYFTLGKFHQCHQPKIFH